MTEKTVLYKQGAQELEGFLVLPAQAKAGAPLPAVILIHEWDGLGDYLKRRARMIAELGYVAFAADIYGKGIRAHSMEEAGKLATQYKSNRPLLRARAQAAWDQVLGIKEVDPSRIAVMGYCFGGTSALELGMTGDSLKGIVSFHGGLDFPTDLADLKNMKGKVLVLHGADDPTISQEQIQKFKDELKKSGISLNFVAYPGAVHAFTNPAHEFKAGAAIGYNAKADAASWEEMKHFFKSIF